MKIVMVASEARPFCKTGGLADVVYSLSKELAVQGEDVSIILPFYDSIRRQLANEKLEKAASFNTHMSWRQQNVDVYQINRDGIKYYLIENRQYFERGHIYGDFDDGERFGFFTMAAKELMLAMKMNPDIVHVHDWQAGMLPCIMRVHADARNKFTNTKYVFTIHNPAFQGLMPKFTLGDFYNLTDELFDNGSVRFKDQVSTLKAGIIYSDKITTVSPTHHLELLTPEGGMGLDGVLVYREWDFSGILNGIDYLEFNPENDPQIEAAYNAKNFISGKAKNKEALLKAFNLPDTKGPVYSLVTRITWQKGFDIIYPAVEEVVNRGATVIMLGSGEYQYEQKWEELRRRYPDRIGLYIGYSDPLAHKVYAGSDFFIMPSLFEPCGLGQMIAQRYGTLPIVRRTGGLRDSVICYDGSNEETSNGFGFDSYSVYEMNRTAHYAFEVYQDKKLLHRLMKNAMLTDNSWQKSTQEYLKVYKQLINK